MKIAYCFNLSCVKNTVLFIKNKSLVVNLLIKKYSSFSVASSIIKGNLKICCSILLITMQCPSMKHNLVHF